MRVSADASTSLGSRPYASNAPHGRQQFGRQAYVGLDLPWATVTLGRQYDFMFELGRYSAGQFMGSYALRPATGLAFLGNNGSSPDFDRVGGARVDNAAKVVSKEVGHTVVGALLSFGGQPGSFSAGRTMSLGARYGANDFGIGAAYTTRRDDTAPASFEVFGAGASYRLARWTFQALYTHSKWALTGDKVAVYEVSARYQVNTPLFLSAGGGEHRAQSRHCQCNPAGPTQAGRGGRGLLPVQAHRRLPGGGLPARRGGQRRRAVSGGQRRWAQPDRGQPGPASHVLSGGGARQRFTSRAG
ncbi:porin [Chitinasiproducens palmae]|uniref:Porin n=1 Tax=Chitinasiproducens palmae TaxID=1770053 RepID=A0A1H2PLB9_9BURK|nr:porin [Chitinasiproducens palmae]